MQYRFIVIVLALSVLCCASQQIGELDESRVHVQLPDDSPVAVDHILIAKSAVAAERAPVEEKTAASAATDAAVDAFAAM